MKLTEETTKHDFAISSEEGWTGEEAYLAYFRHLIKERQPFAKDGSRIESYEDVRDGQKHPHYREVDIDVILHFINDKTGKKFQKTIEIKTDWTKYHNENVFVETKSSRNSVGCFFKTEADMLIYYFPLRGYSYWMEPKNYKPIFSNSIIPECDKRDDLVRKRMEDAKLTPEQYGNIRRKLIRKQIPNIGWGNGYSGEGYAIPVPRLMQAKAEEGLVFNRRRFTHIPRSVFESFATMHQEERRSSIENLVLAQCDSRRAG